MGGGTAAAGELGLGGCGADSDWGKQLVGFIQPSLGVKEPLDLLGGLGSRDTAKFSSGLNCTGDEAGGDGLFLGLHRHLAGEAAGREGGRREESDDQEEEAGGHGALKLRAD